MKNLFKNKLLQSVLVLLGALFIFEYVIAPGLTAASSITNIISVLLSVVILFGLFKYLDSISGKKTDKDITQIPPGETELDYVPKPKMKAKPKVTKTKTTKTK